MLLWRQRFVCCYFIIIIIMFLINLYFHFCFIILLNFCLYYIYLNKNIYNLLFLITLVYYLCCSYLYFFFYQQISLIFYLFIQSGVLLILLIFNFIFSWRRWNLYFNSFSNIILYFLYIQIFWYLLYIGITTTPAHVFVTTVTTVILHFGDLFFNFCLYEWIFLNYYLCLGIFTCGVLCHFIKLIRVYQIYLYKCYKNIFFLKQTYNFIYAQPVLIYFKYVIKRIDLRN